MGSPVTPEPSTGTAPTFVNNGMVGKCLNIPSGAYVKLTGSDSETLAGNFDEDGTHGEISPLGGDTPAKGTYHDIELSLVASRGTESETLTITLPTFIVE